jgi:hypothetical protein
MRSTSIPQRAYEMLLSDAMQRDRVTARRVRLLQTLWQERYLTREQLISRLKENLELAASALLPGKMLFTAICGL